MIIAATEFLAHAVRVQCTVWKHWTLWVMETREVDRVASCYMLCYMPAAVACLWTYLPARVLWPYTIRDGLQGVVFDDTGFFVDNTGYRWCCIDEFRLDGQNGCWIVTSNFGPDWVKKQRRTGETITQAEVCCIVQLLSPVTTRLCSGCRWMPWLRISACQPTRPFHACQI